MTKVYLTVLAEKYVDFSHASCISNVSWTSVDRYNNSFSVINICIFSFSNIISSILSQKQHLPIMSSKQGRKIAMLGASGTVGTPTVTSLLNIGIHTITVISRADSHASFPEGVHVKKGDYSDESFLVSALQGQDVLILQLGFGGMDSQTLLIAAAAKAGVTWVLPTEFGSDHSARLAQNLPMMTMKNQYREQAEKLGLRWIGVINNPWFDWSLKQDLWGIDIPARKAVIYNGGNVKFNANTLSAVGEGVASLLSLPDDKLHEYDNRFVYLSCFYTTQNEILQSVLRATGTKESDWEITHSTTEERLKEDEAIVASGNPMGFIKGFYAQHLREGYGGDYQSKAVKDAEVLGVKGGDLDATVKGIVDELAASK
jgi:uncharacterized protein YbjT (DUF2867 family)